MTGSDEVPLKIVERLRSVCLRLPEAYEEPAWVGTRWRIRKRTFAHVLTIEESHPAAYARAADATGPICVITFRSPAEELDALTNVGHPYFRASWGRDVAGMVIEDDVDWSEIAELLTESYCVLAPKKLIGLVDRPAD